MPVSQLPPMPKEFVPHGPSSHEIIDDAVSVDQPSILIKRLHVRILLAAHMRYLDHGPDAARKAELATLLNDAEVAPLLDPFIEHQRAQLQPTNEIQEAQAVIGGVQRIAMRPELLLRSRVFAS